MNENPKAYKSVRLPCFAYNEPGAYFVTICTAGRACVLGAIENDTAHLTDVGEIVREELLRSFSIRKELMLDCHVIMPNHLHVVVIIGDADGAHYRAALRESASYDADLKRGTRQRSARSISSFVAQFKAVSTKRVNELRRGSGERLWQPSFYEHVIRTDDDLNGIRVYVQSNPAQWALDRENPDVHP